MKNRMNKRNNDAEKLNDADIKKKQKTRKRLFISIGGIILSAALATSLTVGISIAKKEVK